MKIPSENLYYVLCYAWERLDRLKDQPSDVRTAGFELPQDLLACLLRDSFSRVLRRGLDRGYRECAEETRRPRGKVDLARTVRRALRVRRQVCVRYEELSRNVLHNRIVKTTMSRLAAVTNLDGGLRADLVRLALRIPDVTEVELRDDLFSRVQIHRNNADYGFLLDLCRLLARHLFPAARAGTVRFRDFTADDREMGLLFEAFVRGFLRIEHPELGVHPGHRQIEWKETPESGAKRFPVMQADVYMQGVGGACAIVETKCVSNPFAGVDGGRSDSLRSDHLYQIFAYLANHARSYPDDPLAFGVLLYATAGATFDYRYRVHGHPLWVRSVDLAKPWQTVRADLHHLALALSEQTRTNAPAVA